MNISDLAKLIGAEYNGKNIKFSSIKTNTKELSKNDIFIAIDKGHNYLDTIKKCRGVIVNNDFETTKFPVLRVDDTKESLEIIALYKRSKFKGKVIAITGSNGKTTTKELLSHVLKTKYKVFKSKENMNNNLGLLINMLSLDNYQYAIFELGMNHKGEISELSKLVKPDIGLITNIGTAHIGNLGSKKDIYDAKLEIIDGMNNINLIVNGMDKYLKKCKLGIPIFMKNSLFEISNIKENINYVEFDLKIDKCYHIKYHVPSIMHLTNVILVIYVSLILKIKASKIAKSLNNFKCVKSRMEVIKLKDKIIINDSYNSNYESLIAGITSLKNYPLDKICIIGAILELGSKENYIYEKISRNLNKDYFYIFIGNNIKAPNAIYLDNVDSLINYYYLNKELFFNKVIYVKGSHAINLLKFVDEIRK